MVIRLLGSASKLVFLMLAVTVCAAFLFGRLDSPDFMVLACMAFTFYFASKGEAGQPFAGK